MVKNLENPIQQVLEAERAADAEIGAAREAAETAVTAARKQVPTILRRNEIRTQRAVERYEKQQTKLLQAKTQALRQQGKAKFAGEQTLLDERFDEVVDELFRDIWSQDDPD